MNKIDLGLLQEANAFLSAALNAARQGLDLVALVDAESALHRLKSLLSRNPLPINENTPHSR